MHKMGNFYNFETTFYPECEAIPDSPWVLMTKHRSIETPVVYALHDGRTGLETSSVNMND